MVAHSYHPRSQARGWLRVQGHPGLQSKTVSNEKEQQTSEKALSRVDPDVVENRSRKCRLCSAQREAT